MPSATATSSASLAEQIRSDIEHKTIKLPTLPEVALRVREVIESDRAGADAIARVVSQDAALSARLLQIANSPLYPGHHRIDSLVHAIARLGAKVVRTLVTSLIMKQLFQARSPAPDRQLHKVWDTSVRVAAISRVLADNVPGLESDQAMLGGLVHNIGALPILTWMNERSRSDVGEALIAQVIEDIGPAIGNYILRQWHFVDPLADIPTACRDLHYDPGPTATYADVVLVARLQHMLQTRAQGALIDWSRIPAFRKIGIETEVIVISTEEPADKIAEVRKLLGS